MYGLSTVGFSYNTYSLYTEGEEGLAVFYFMCVLFGIYALYRLWRGDIAEWQREDGKPLRTIPKGLKITAAILAVVLGLTAYKAIKTTGNMRENYMRKNQWWYTNRCRPECRAICNDGYCSDSLFRRGTCSWHGGVETWCR